MLMTRHHVRKGGLKLAMDIMIGKGIKTSRKRKPYTNEPHGPKRVNTQNYYVCSRGIRYQNISATFSPFRVENKTAHFYRNPILLSGPDGQNCYSVSWCLKKEIQWNNHDTDTEVIIEPFDPLIKSKLLRQNIWFNDWLNEKH